MQAAQKLSQGLNFAREYIVPYFESALGRRPRIPTKITITRLPEWAQFNGIDPCCKSMTVSKMLAGLLDDGMILGDVSLATAPQDLIDYWLIPHELLHTLGLAEETIDRILVILNRRLGNHHVVSYITDYSQYIQESHGSHH